jgi:hypothetical protein
MREDYFVKIGEELEAQASASANAEAEMRMRALAEEIEAAKEEINAGQKVNGERKTRRVEKVGD